MGKIYSSREIKGLIAEAAGYIPLIVSIIAPAGRAQRINITMDRAF